MQGHVFLLCASLLVTSSWTQTIDPPNLTTRAPKSASLTPTHTLTPSSSSSLIENPTSTTTNDKHTGQSWAHSWNENIAQTMEGLVGALVGNPKEGNDSLQLSQFLAQLPGIFKGITGTNFRGNDVGKILGSLLGDSRTGTTPAWIEALMNQTIKNNNNNNSLEALQDAAQILQAFSKQNPNQQLQTFLSHIFPDVLKGLSSLNLGRNSSTQDILTAILNDPSIMSSLSTTGQMLLSNLTRQAGFQNFVTEALKNEFPVDPNSQCAADLKAFGNGLQQGQMWALQMLDAMGKLNAGLFTGMVTLFGDYDECRAISYTDPSSHTIEGLFCGMAIKAPQILSQKGLSVIGLHTCLPSSCSEGYRYQMVQPLLKSIGSQFYGQYCYRTRKPHDDDRFTGVVITLAILAALCAAGTVYGAILSYKKKKGQEYELKTPVQNVTAYDNGAFVKETKVDAKNGSYVIPTVTNGSMTNGVGEKPAPPDTSVAAIGGSEGVSQSAPQSEKAPAPEEGMCSKLLLSFSVLRNGRKALATNKNPRDISCLHGIRVLSITWVILGHCFTQLGASQGNSNFSVVLLQYFTYSVFPGALLSVDTFFLLSGCLTAFLFLRATKKTGLTPSALFLYYFHRIWRLTPLYGLILAFYMGIFPYIKRGPFENLQGMDSENNCRKYWYYNILYINNVVDDSISKLCLGWSWYLSNDMQFFVIAPIILIPWVVKGELHKAGQIIGWILAISLIIVHSVTSGVLTYKNDYSMFKKAGQFMEDVYFTPWCRVGPYAVGLLVGYILHKTPRTYKMPPVMVLIGWTLAWAVGLTLVYVQYDNLHDLMHGVRWNREQTAAFEALAKWIWAICVGWVIFACHTGYGGFVNTLLSWGAWAPLSRLTYGTYLIHLAVIFVLTGNHKKKLYIDGWTGTELTLAVTVLSYMASFGFSMLIEAPTLGLEKVILGKIFKQKKN